MTMWRTLLMVVALGLLGSCASVSQEECLAGNWAAIGERDGRQGQVPATILARHDSACARVDVTPDRSQWQQGYDRGLAQYCTPSGGLEAGRAGRPYRNVCPASAEPRFLDGFELGRAGHRAEERVRSTEREISQLQSRRRSLLSEDGEDADARRREAGLIQSELGMLRLELLAARNELARVEREIRRFRAGL
jgi:hypothetical protein